MFVRSARSIDRIMVPGSRSPLDLYGTYSIDVCFTMLLIVSLLDKAPFVNYSDVTLLCDCRCKLQGF